ncbi:MAG: Ca2+-transporting ATPase [Parcubacteria group bacterium Gr01-1014_66]|nr:MAG: Ca2+-transporting ATPase [Parcubacteria group bacterium Gr01-1014_66]
MKDKDQKSHLDALRRAQKESLWAKTADEALRLFATSLEGLHREEVKARAASFGPNEILLPQGRSGFAIFCQQFRSPLIVILLGAGIITWVLKEWGETVTIFAAVVVNTALGFMQERKAETALLVVQSYVRTRTRIRRDRSEQERDAAVLVPGDLIRITRGDRIPADGRIVMANNLEVDESVLTGESLPIVKRSVACALDTPLAERISMVMAGTLVVRGFADVMVSATGNSTEFGKIAALLHIVHEAPTPLQRAVTRFSLFFGGILLTLTLFLFLGGIRVGYDVQEMFLIVVAVAVSAVPEGLPVALTMVLAVGVERLAEKRGIVRRLGAAETLGVVDVILTDKTGTLTQARMELVAIFPRSGEEDAGIKTLLASALLHTDVVIENPEDIPDQWRITGKGIEEALVRGAAARGVLLPRVKSVYTIQGQIPFESTRKFSVVGFRWEGKNFCSIFGAPEAIISRAELGEQERKNLLMKADSLARSGQRVLALGVKEIYGEEKSLTLFDAEDGFMWYGFIGVRDPLRPSVRAALQGITKRGVLVVMVTGDHQGTAEAIAREVGILRSSEEVMNADVLNTIPQEQLQKSLERWRVFARVTPAQKLLLVRAYQRAGKVVAVTGDGVNDAPALEAADVGIAIGSGTDVAKQAADLVVLDDDFGTIVRAIEEGRRILANMRKVITYLLSDSFDEVLLVGGALVTGLPLPLTALQILFVNFFSDSLPALALAFERNHRDLEYYKLEERHALFDRTVKTLVWGVGVVTSFLLFVIYALLLYVGFPEMLARSFIFASFATYTLLFAFSVRDLRNSIFTYNPLGNRWLTGGVCFGLMLTAAAIYVPFLQKLLGTVALPPVWVVMVVVVGFVNLGIAECAKWWCRRNPAK